MELRHLRCFVAVAETGNIHRAAKRLNISQPPLSLTIQQLETDIGTPLFSRVGRGIQITRAGEEFLIHAKKILNDANIAKRRVKNIGDGVEGILKIGFVSSAVTGILQNYVLRFKKRYPQFELDIKQSKNSLIPSQLLSRDIDIGILRLPENIPDGLKIRHKEDEGWCAAVHTNHHFAAKKTIKIKDFDGEDIIFYPRENSAAGYDDVMNMFQSKNITPHVVQEATEQMTIAGLCASGVGIGIVPSCMLRIKVDGLVHRPIEDTKSKTALAIITRNERDDVLDRFLNP